MNAATSVHQTLQGAVIPSSGRGGMRIQYPLLIEKMLDSSIESDLYLDFQFNNLFIITIHPYIDMCLLYIFYILDIHTSISLF